MKKWLKLMTVCALLLTLCLFAGCDSELFGQTTTPQETTTEDATTTPKDTTTPEENVNPPAPLDPDQPAGSVLVDSIGGKNAIEVMENFIDTFNSAESYDWNATMELIEDGVVTSEYMSIKIYNGEVAVIMQDDDTANEVYFVDGILYINQNGQKMRLPVENPEEMLGEGFFDGLMEMVPDFSEERELLLEDTKIYLLNGIYYITIHKVDEETDEEETYCYQFNEAGELVKADCTSNTEKSVLVINSYGKPVQITPPADADEYTSVGNAVVPEGAVAVDTVNGMNATQLFEKFIAEYAASTAYDINIKIKQTSGDETVTMSMAVKLTQDAVYYGMAMDFNTQSIWVVDGTAYMFTNGERIKQTGVSIEDVFGDGTFEALIGSVVADIPDEYYTYLAEAQLYYYDGLYFYSIAMFLPESGMTTEIVFFDETGTVVRIVDQAEGISVTSTINSYGNKPVIITPPKDADLYVEASEIPENPILPESEDEIYAFYTDACTTFQSATHYGLSLFIDGEEMANYNIAGSDKYITVVSNGTAISQWLINNVGYASINYQNPTQTEITDTFLETFARFEAMFPIDVLAKAELQKLQCSYNANYDEIVIEFEYTDEEGNLAQYTYAIPRSGGYIDITVTEIVNGTEDSSYNFFFVIVPDLEITLP